LGNAYENGLGVPADLNEALKWYEAAAGHGNDMAKKRLEKPN
jgi:TPR repeat protein